MTIDYVSQAHRVREIAGLHLHDHACRCSHGVAERVFDVKPTIWDKITLNLVQVWFVWPTVLLRTLFVVAVVVRRRDRTR